ARRGHASGDDGGGAREVEAGIPGGGRHGDGRQRLDAERRCRGGGGGVGGRGGAVGGEAAGPRRVLCDERRGAEGHFHRAGGRGEAGAGEGEVGVAGHRPV